MKKSRHNCDLQSCTFCKGCLPEWQPAIRASRKNFHFTKGEKLFTEGSNVDGMFFIHSGKVKVHKKWDEAKDIIVRFAGKGEIVGHRGMGGSPCYPVSATALEPVDVCFFDLDFFYTSLQINHAFAFQFILFFAEELQESEKKMHQMAHMPVRGRVCEALLKLSDKFGTDADRFIDIAITRQDIASYAGTTYETVFRIMNELQEENIIITQGKKIAILNRGALLQDD